jgi:hypothetical protein
MKNLFREPLLHFLLIGAGLFLVFRLAKQNDADESDQRIVVTAGRIDQLETVFEKTWQRPPTKEELQGLVNDFVLEEAYYRRAVAMGIDRNDTIIRRRLRQKLEFLTDTASLLEPTDDELATYLIANQDRFRASSTYTFQQIYINPERHGDSPETYVAQQLEILRSGKRVNGDSGLLPEAFEGASRQSLDNTFGAGFSLQLDGLAQGQWHGPISSGLGLHMIRVESRADGRLPDLAEIRAVVQREWINEKTVASRQEMNERMRKEFDVVVEWPAANSESSGEVDAS